MSSVVLFVLNNQVLKSRMIFNLDLLDKNLRKIDIFSSIVSPIMSNLYRKAI